MTAGWQHGVIALLLSLGFLASWESSMAAGGAQSLCTVRLSQEDAMAYFRQSTTIAQRRLYDAIVDNKDDVAVSNIPQAGSVNFRVPGYEWLISHVVATMNIKIVGALLQAGADPNRVDCNGWPSLAYLEIGPNASTASTDTTLVALAELLVSHGATIEGNKNAKWRGHLLALAARNGHTALINWLIKRGAEVNVEDVGFTPLMLSVQENHVDATRALIDLGADVNAASPISKTPLMIAIDVGNPDLVSLLIAHRANVNERRVWGSPLSDALGRQFLPAHKTAEQGPRDDEIIKLLIDAGAKT